MSKRKDLKSINKKKKDLAQMLTILRQKELIKELEDKAEESNGSNETNESKVQKGEIKWEEELFQSKWFTVLLFW